MSGHSHWAGIKYKKAIVDSRRGKRFSKLSKLIMQAAKSGADPVYNVKLRDAVEKAQSYNMPKDKITAAIKKGSGQTEGYDLSEVVYEGYGPGGIAIMVEALTDNKKRTAPEIRNIFEKRNGNFCSPGGVSWKFSAKGLFIISNMQADEDEFLETMIEHGMEDYSGENGGYEIYTLPDSFADMKECLTELGIEFKGEITKVPNASISIAKDTYRKILPLMEELEDHDDVQEVYADFNVTEETVEAAENKV